MEFEASGVCLPRRFPTFTCRFNDTSMGPFSVNAPAKPADRVMVKYLVSLVGKEQKAILLVCGQHQDWAGTFFSAFPRHEILYGGKLQVLADFRFLRLGIGGE